MAGGIKVVTGANPSIVLGATAGAAQAQQRTEAYNKQLLAKEREKAQKRQFEQQGDMAMLNSALRTGEYDYQLTAQQRADQEKYRNALYEIDQSDDFSPDEKVDARRKVMSKLAGIKPPPILKEKGEFGEGRGVNEDWTDEFGNRFTRDATGQPKLLTRGPDIGRIVSDAVKSLTTIDPNTGAQVPPSGEKLNEFLRTTYASTPLSSIFSGQQPAATAPGQAAPAGQQIAPPAAQPTLPPPSDAAKPSARPQQQYVGLTGGPRTNIPSAGTAQQGAAGVPSAGPGPALPDLAGVPSGPPPGQPPAGIAPIQVPGIGSLTPIGDQFVQQQNRQPINVDMAGQLTEPKGFASLLNKYNLSDLIANAGEVSEKDKTAAFSKRQALEQAMKGTDYRAQLRAYKDYDSTVRTLVRKASTNAPERYADFF